MGEVVAVFSDFNFNASDSEEYPITVYNQARSGDGKPLVAPYPFLLQSLFFWKCGTGQYQSSMKW
jgi:hypothetical protein